MAAAAIAQINPDELGEAGREIESLIELRRWFEAGEALTALLARDIVAGHRLRLFEAIILRHDSYLDAFHFAGLALAVVPEIADADDCVAFLRKCGSSSVLQRSPQAKDLLDLRVVSLLARKGDIEGAHQLVHAIGARINETTLVRVRAAFHRAQADIDKARGDHDAFYVHAFLLLSTARIGRDPVLAFDLCAANLLADSLSSFGGLAAHPILDSLAGTEHAWLGDLIRLLERGTPDAVEAYARDFAPAIAASDVFGPFAEAIRRKVALSVFVELIFKQPFDARTFSFDAIANTCRIEKGAVERLVMTALATGVIRGTVDEVAETVVVTWCKPKHVAGDGLLHVKAQLDRWIDIVHRQRVALEERAQTVVG